MDNEQIEYTVEYQDNYGVMYFENVKANNVAEAKMQISQRLPDVVIRAITVVSKENGE
ncbi:hypothetical protein [Paenibacillus radicis (ex Gao et al. 2016)]|uniref:Uncharacterized protein n=1 Tax=Paenibacillus radicis (ex Gao et al. 2016) TaxID=1737354 RepID=A0A917M4Q5_9BACL|nr:hypothetical protein [Paenibacillus radicis (ex Gao et al. 2016)]GGG78662.1 hypothetical protein GCM10010918_39520 [Paenibacillus radicis (ex Gao et al. 2016)]